MKKSIQRIKNDKTLKPDNIHGDVMKLVEDQYLDIIEQLFNRIYNTGNMLEGWLLSTFIPLPKKLQCKSYALQIFLCIIHDQIYPFLEKNTSIKHNSDLQMV